MPPAERGRPYERRGPLLALLAIGAAAAVVGVALRFSVLDEGSLWLDELWTLDAVSRSFREMIGARLVSDQSPPLWLVLTWIWLHLTGTYDAGAMRLLPALFGVIAIAAPMVGAARLRSLRPTLVVMASMLALSTFTVHYSVELRPYSTMIAFETVSTVIWAALLARALPWSGTWIFLFALTGALGGFGNYYGNVPYLVESAILLVVLARGAGRRPLVLHVLWGGVSITPVIAWYVFARPWAPNLAVAEPPSLGQVQAWSAYAFAPVTNVGIPVFVAATAFILGVLAFRQVRGGEPEQDAVAMVGLSSAVVLIVGIAIAWTASLLLPPSMNTRNLGALLPSLFLTVASAITIARSWRVRSLAGSAVIAIWLVAIGGMVSRYGVASFAPPWHVEAGYRNTVSALNSAAKETPPVTLIGVEAGWDWHGQWDAAMAAHFDASPRMPSDPSLLPVSWVLNTSETPASISDGPLIVFADGSATAASDVIAWAEGLGGACVSQTFGGPGFGATVLVRCE